jgi:4-hydroxybenzoyl-CoA thioesterase
MPKEAAPNTFVYEITPAWFDLDPARIVYTGRYTDFAMRAIDGWFLDRVGADFYRMNFEWGISTPFIHTECDFHAPLTTHDTLLLSVYPEKIGSRALTFRVEGTAQEEEIRCFVGRFVCVCVHASMGSRRKRAIRLDPRIEKAARSELSPSIE